MRMFQNNKLRQFLSLVDVHEFKQRYSEDVDNNSYFGYPLDKIIEIEKRLRSDKGNSVAYISMEYGLATSFYNIFKRKGGISEKNKVLYHKIFSNMRIEDYLFDFRIDETLDLPLYSGGLGVLAGDTLKTAADLGLPLVAIGILWEKGYFKQNFWFKYGQVPEERDWDPHSYPGLISLKNIIKIKFKRDIVYLRLWKYYVFSYDKKSVVPLILLDSNVPENSEEIRKLTNQLYRSSNNWIRIMQRSILGIGAVKALDELGYKVCRYHLNEGHAAMAFVEKAIGQGEEELSNLRKEFVFTCHTPVVAGHDRFPLGDLEKIFPSKEFSFLMKYGKEDNNELINLTLLLLSNCENINSVSKKHQYVTHSQFPQFKDKIISVTNGIHISTWVSESFAQLFDKYKNTVGDYRRDPSGLKRIVELKGDRQFKIDLWNAHKENKRRLSVIFNRWKIEENVFTICWARRIAQYKRPSLIFQDAKRLLSIAKNKGRVQIILAGKAHPADNLAGTYIGDMMNSIDNLSKEFENLRIIMLENYDIFFGKLLTSCVDVWLNNPLPPFEASGTSGMKAMLNGVIQLTTLDGWVVEAQNKQIGEIFGYQHRKGEPIGSESELRLKEDSEALYNSLEKLVSLYYKIDNNGDIDINSQWIDFMINCIAESHYFNTHRMVKEYKEKMWRI